MKARASILRSIVLALAVASCGRTPPDPPPVAETSRALAWDDPLFREVSDGNFITNCDHPKFAGSVTAEEWGEYDLSDCPVIRVCMNLTTRNFTDVDGAQMFFVDPRILLHPDFRGTLEIQFPREVNIGMPVTVAGYEVNVWDGFGRQISTHFSEQPCLYHWIDPEGLVCLDDVGAAMVYSGCVPGSPDWRRLTESNPPAIVEVIEYAYVPGGRVPNARGVTYLIPTTAREGLPPPTRVDARWDPAAGPEGAVRVTWDAVPGADRYYVIPTQWPLKYVFSNLEYLLGGTGFALPEHLSYPPVTGTEAIVEAPADWLYYVAAAGPSPDNLPGMPSSQVPVPGQGRIFFDEAGRVVGVAPVLTACGPHMVPPGTPACCTGAGFGTRAGTISVDGVVQDPALIVSWTDREVCFRHPWDPYNVEQDVSIVTDHGATEPVELVSWWDDIRIFEVVPNHGQPGDEVVIRGENLWAHLTYSLSLRDTAVALALEVVDHDAAGLTWARVRIPATLPADAPPLGEDLLLTASATTRWSAGHLFTLHAADVNDEVLTVVQADTAAADYTRWFEAAASSGGTPAFQTSEFIVPRPGLAPPRTLAGAFDLVFWTTGPRPFATLGGRGVPAVEDLLAAGGALWLEGNRLPTDLRGTDLLRGALHADLAGSAPCTGTLVAPAGSPLASALPTPIALACGVSTVDTLDPLDGQVLLTLGPGGPPVMVGFGNRVVVGSVLLSDVDSSTDPAAPAPLVAAVLAWLGVLP